MLPIVPFINQKSAFTNYCEVFVLFLSGVQRRMKISIIAILFCFTFQLLVSTTVYAQQVNNTGIREYDSAEYAQIQQDFGRHKQIPAIYRNQILIALSHFPELKKTHIRIRVKHAYSPLKTTFSKGSAFTLFFSKKFIITISDSSIDLLSPILYKQLDFNAQVGVIGHELSHVADFSAKGFFGLVGMGLGFMSSRYIDQLEYKTDSICIAHGLGHYLLAWSQFVRNALHSKNYDGADNIKKPMNRERYMNPLTIIKRIEADPQYHVKP